MNSPDRGVYSDISMTLTRLTSLLIIAIAALTGNAATADDTPVVRPVTSSYAIEAGSIRIADTYLTPLHYSGWSTALSYERMQAMRFAPDQWIMRLTTSFSLDKTHNPTRNASVWGIDADASWAMIRRFRLSPLPSLTLGVGGVAEVTLGALYSTRNGNNPVSAKASATVGLTGYAAYNFTLGHLPITLRYQPTLPVTGAFFSPDYGELYYEIYLGNHSGLAHAAWWGNYFRLDNLLTADLHFGGTSLRIGYHGNILSTKVNNIVTRNISYRAMIGVSGEWMTINRRHPLSKEARIISAIY